jgi:hypothetical protein
MHGQLLGIPFSKLEGIMHDDVQLLVEVAWWCG